jgi:O-antigen/teichoic acid export membrane protein
MTPTDMSSAPIDEITPIPASRQRPLVHGVFLMFGTKTLVQICSIAGTVILARTLGPSGRGAVAVAFGFALLLVQFGNLGLQSANLYFAARDLRDIGMIVLNTLWGMVGIGVVLILVLLGAETFFPSVLRGLDRSDVIVLAAGMPALFAMAPLQSVFLAEGRLGVYNGIELAGSLFVLASLAIGLEIFDVGVTGALVIMVTASWGMVLAFVMLQRSLIPRLRRPDMTLFSKMLKYGFRIYLTTSITYMVGRINLLLVNAYFGPAQAGFYAIGIAIGENLHLLPTIVPLNLFPRIARGETFESSATVFRILSIVFGGLCLLTIPLAKPALDLLYGSRFSPAADIYYWLLPGIFCYGLISTLAYHFAGRGFPIEAMLVWVPGLVINLAILLIFMPGGGPNVAALASSIAYAVVLALHMRLFVKESGGYRILLPRPRDLKSLLDVLGHGLSVRSRHQLES